MGTGGGVAVRQNHPAFLHTWEADSCFEDYELTVLVVFGAVVLVGFLAVVGHVSLVILSWTSAL